MATSFAVYLLILLALWNIECAVIKLQDIPITYSLTMTVTIKGDPHNKNEQVASIYLEIEEKKNDDFLNNIVKKYVKPANETIPDFDNRSLFVAGKCPIGKFRRGQVCV